MKIINIADRRQYYPEHISDPDGVPIEELWDWCHFNVRNLDYQEKTESLLKKLNGVCARGEVPYPAMVLACMKVVAAARVAIAKEPGKPLEEEAEIIPFRSARARKKDISKQTDKSTNNADGGQPRPDVKQNTLPL